MRGKYEKPRPRRRWKLFLSILLVAVMLLSAAGMGAYFYLDDMLDLITRAEVLDRSDETVDPAMLGNFEETQLSAIPTTQPVPTTSAAETTVPTEPAFIPSGKDIINVLVVGQAAREGETAHYADTMILVTVNRNTSTIHLHSFLRDTYVDMPDYKGNRCGWNRINMVYHLGWEWGGTGGAMENMNTCLKNSFGIEVDHNVEVDFEAFSKIIDLLGGVRVTLTEAEADYMNNGGKTWQEVTPGENRLFGDAALVYARMRKAAGDYDSDIRRTERQRTVVTALIEKLRYRSFGELQDLVKEVLPMVITNMTNEEILTCMWESLPLLPYLKIETGTCPIKTTYKGEIIDINGVPSSVLKYDQIRNYQLMTPITEGYEKLPWD